jgi:hypothetical protein
MALFQRALVAKSGSCETSVRASLTMRPEFDPDATQMFHPAKIPGIVLVDTCDAGRARRKPAVFSHPLQAGCAVARGQVRKRCIYRQPVLHTETAGAIAAPAFLLRGCRRCIDATLIRIADSRAHSRPGRERSTRFLRNRFIAI